MSTINNYKPKIKRKELLCQVCKQYKLCISYTLYDMIICRKCWKDKKGKYLACDYCGICGNLSPDEEVKFCTKCDNDVGMCCGALYYCQSVECECLNCYNYLCIECGINKLPKDKQYCEDTDIHEDYYPLCESCRNKL